MEQTVYVGGAVIGYASPKLCRKLTKVCPLKGKMIKLGPEPAKLLLNPAWRRKNL